MSKRVIAKVAVFEGAAYQTLRFSPSVYLGDPVNICNILSDQGGQEINLLFPHCPPELDYICKILSVCRAPVSIGGLGNCIETVKQVISSGAEKVILSDTLWLEPNKIREIALSLGRQAVALSIDYEFRGQERVVMSGERRNKEQGKLNDCLQRLDCSTFGELILNCISRDGTAVGLDTKVYSDVPEHLKELPLLISGGYSPEVDSISQLPFDGVCISRSISLFGSLEAPLTCYPFEHSVLKPIEN